MKIAAVTLYPDKKAGSALYSHKLYAEISKYCTVVILSDNEANHKDNVKMVNAWRRKSLLMPFQLFKHILRQKPHICHFQIEYKTFNDNAAISAIENLLLLLLTRITSINILVTLHGVIPFATTEKVFERKATAVFYNVPLRIFYKALEFSSKKIIVHTNLMENILRAYGLSNNKIAVIPHGVDRARQFYGGDKKEGLTVLFHGFIRPSKGLEWLIKAMQNVAELHPRVKLIIAGETPHQEKRKGHFHISQLRREIRCLQLENHVKIIKKFLSENELEKLILESDVLVLPYIDNFFEASGALARVMDYGKPLICTKIPRFLGDLKNGEDCIMVSPCDAQKLAEAVIELVQNEKLRKKIGENLKEKASCRYWDILAKEYVQLYEENA